VAVKWRNERRVPGTQTQHGRGDAAYQTNFVASTVSAATSKPASSSRREPTTRFATAKALH